MVSALRWYEINPFLRTAEGRRAGQRYELVRVSAWDWQCWFIDEMHDVNTILGEGIFSKARAKATAHHRTV